MKTSPLPFLALALALSVSGFAADGDLNGALLRTVKVTISPTSVSLRIRQSQQFTASVSGSDNKRVDWLVNGIVGGDSAVGTINSAGLYTAPSSAPSSAVTIKARSVVAPTVSASANVSVRRGDRVTVSISPASANLQANQSQQFHAAVSGTMNKSVHWLVNGTLGGNATAGTISSSGTYTAPATAPSSAILVTAQSAAQPTVSASAKVSFTPTTVSVSVSPVSATVQVSKSQQFNATVSGTNYTGVNWLVNGVSGGNSSVGMISSSGLYTAPSSVPAGSISVTAQSSAQPAATASASVSVLPVSITVSISPTSASVVTGQTEQFSAYISGTSNTAVTWLVSGVVGGNGSVGTISSAGLYSAPSTVPSGSVTVTAKSTANPSSSASASVSVISPVNHSVSLSWTETGTSIIGYYIYRSTQPSGPFTKLNSSLDPATAYTDSTVVSGKTYYYATTSVNSSGTQSGYSNVAQAVVP